MSTTTSSHTWRDERRDLARAVTGALVFAVPMIFTLEMWSIAATLPIWKVLALIAIAFPINIGLAYYAGFKQDPTLLGALDQAIEVLAIGAVIGGTLLFVLQRISPSDSLAMAVKSIALQAVPLSIGASIANSLFTAYQQDEPLDDAESQPGVAALLMDIGTTMVGGLFIGFGIIPTDEVVLLAAEVDTQHLILLMVATLIISYVIVFATQAEGDTPQAAYHRAFPETIISFVVSLFVAVLTLFLLGRLEFHDPLTWNLTLAVVLAFPVTIGGAAGRLVL
jgi:putative integral membrane protein (TIGR02587 family)